MQLYEGIKKALEATSADGATLSAASMEMLDDLKCFDRRPELRFIVSTAIRSGAFERFSRYGEGTEQPLKFLHHFVSHTGFRKDLAAEAFTAYARAIGWSEKYLPLSEDDENVCADAECAEVAEPKEIYKKETAGDWRMMPLPDKIRILNESLTMDMSKSGVFGATAERAKVINIDATGIVLTAMLHRLTPMGGCQLRYALYDADDELIAVGEGAQMSVYSTDRLPVQFTIPASAIRSDEIVPKRIHLFIN